MKDPCLDCENLEIRKLFIEQNGSSLSGENNSQYRVILRQSFTESREDNLKYKHLFETAPDAIFIADVESGIILEANESAAKLLGVPVDEIIGMHLSQLHPAEEAERYKKIFREPIEKGNALFSDDIYVCRRDGQKIPVQINTTVTQIGSKKIIFGIFRNITQQQQLLDYLEAGEVRFKRLAEAAFEAIAIHAHEKIIDVNRQFLDMFGYTLEEVRKMPGLKMFAPQSRDLVLEKMTSGYEGIYEAFGMKKDGTVFPVEIQAKESELDGQRVRIGAIRDVTEQKQQQEQIKAREALYRAVVENADEVITIFDSEGTFLFLNERAAQGAGWTREEVLGKNLSDFFPKEFAEKDKQRIKQVLETGESIKRVMQVPIKNQLRWHQSSMIPLENAQGEPDRILLIARDVHEEMLLKEKISESERKYRELYEEAPVALFRTALDSTLLQCNCACLSFFGYSTDQEVENYINKINVGDYYVDPGRRDEFIQTLMKKKQVKGFEAELKKADGSTFWVSISAEVFPEAGYIEGTMYDITIRKSLTKSEHRILQILLKGKSNKEIARELRRSVRTIEDHRAHIMRKLGVDNLIDLTRKTRNLHHYHPGK